MELLDQIKISMRISHDKLDENIKSDIETGLLDMRRVGIQPYTNADGSEGQLKDGLIGKAVELYCKAQSDFQGKGDQYHASYENLRDALSLCGEYNEK